MQKNTTYKIIFSLLTLYLVWGSTYLAIKFAIVSLLPLMMSGFRYLGASFIFLAVPLWSCLFAALLGTKPNLQEIIGLCLGFLGILSLNSDKTLQAQWLGAVLLFLAPVFGLRPNAWGKTYCCANPFFFAGCFTSKHFYSAYCGYYWCSLCCFRP